MNYKEKYWASKQRYAIYSWAAVSAMCPQLSTVPNCLWQVEKQKFRRQECDERRKQLETEV